MVATGGATPHALEHSVRSGSVTPTTRPYELVILPDLSIDYSLALPEDRGFDVSVTMQHEQNPPWVLRRVKQSPEWLFGICDASW